MKEKLNIGKTNTEGYNGIVSKRYTGGFVVDDCFFSTMKVKWVETYEEMLNAVALLKSHGSEIPQIPLFNCEEYGIDIKFCIIFPRKAAEELQPGQNYFDRRIDSLDISCYVFFKEVSIERLEYSSYYLYDTVVIGTLGEKIDIPQGTDDIEIHPSKVSNGVQKYYISYRDRYQFYYEKSVHQDFKISKEQLEIFKNTITIIE